MNNYDRLVSLGLIYPLSSDEIYRRDRILDKVAEGQKVRDAPEWVCFRSDDQFKHINLTGKDKCKSAELIMSKLYHWEAHRMCNRLNNHDPELPKNPQGYYQGMYKYATISDWLEFSHSKDQITFFEEE